MKKILIVTVIAALIGAILGVFAKCRKPQMKRM